jgi:hypothetical protein
LALVLAKAQPIPTIQPDCRDSKRRKTFVIKDTEKTDQHKTERTEYDQVPNAEFGP